MDLDPWGPAIDSDGKRATFKLKEAIGGRDSLAFVKVGDFWYIAN